MRIVIDYRPALRARTGVGEYVHQTVRAIATSDGQDEVTLFTSSWADRPPPSLSAEFPHARVVDRRIPVSVLNLLWHRVERPSIEILTGRTFDVAHSPHPLLLPSQSAAQVITIHDLHFLSHPERTSREIRRDYPALVADHARRADRIIVSSQFGASEVAGTLGVDAGKISVCRAGVPGWATGLNGGDLDGYLLFVGTLDSRKNIGGLLDAYQQLLSRRGNVPKLVMVGSATAEAAEWLERIEKPPLAGRVEHLGYVPSERIASVFQGARMLLMPSFEEGFGIPALEAMAVGVPVIAGDRGSLPEVVEDAGLLIDPAAPDALAAAVERLLDDPTLWENLRRLGQTRARLFSWEQTARDVRHAYELAIAAHAHRH